ncbi:ABC transporter permease, partial [Candidatus Saccharibacteria bacterium]|nr:ABC transporter permease [Candidatus Saccharibacteria bacterium]
MIVQHTKMAINSLKSNKVRTFLTLLGIIIGVTSVTTIIGLGEGVKRQVNQQINELGSDLITVTAGKNNHNNDFSFFNPTTNSSSSTAKLSDADLEAIRSTPGVKLAGGIMLLDGSITR